jgi:hypothetical protein
MLLNVRTVALVGAAAVAALLPLYGDPRSAPMTHPEWARMLLRGMDMEEALEASASASRVFSTLSWRESLWMRGGQYMRGQGVQLVGDQDTTFVRASAELGEVVYPLSVVRGGEYRLRARLKGDPSSPAIAQITKAKDEDPEESYTLVPSATSSWLAPDDPMHLEPGTYYATFALPRGTTLEEFEIAPPCVTPVEPLGGWKPADVLDAEDLAVTMVKALDREYELPAAEMPIVVNGSSLRVDETMQTTFVSSPPAGTLEGLWLRAAAGGTRALLEVDLPADGRYSVTAFGLRGRGQQWMADQCRASVLCPAATLAPGEAEVPAWFPVMTAHFSKGRHAFMVSLGADAAIERIHLELKKDTGPDYVATLRRIGFDAGEGPVSRAKAADALAFLQRRYPEDVGKPCILPELLEPTNVQTALQQGVQIGTPGTNPPPVGEPPSGGVPPVEPPPEGPPSTLPCTAPGSPDEPQPCPPN